MYFSTYTGNKGNNCNYQSLMDCNATAECILASLTGNKCNKANNCNSIITATGENVL
jgi:hypothetical protein